MNKFWIIVGVGIIALGALFYFTSGRTNTTNEIISMDTAQNNTVSEVTGDTITAVMSTNKGDVTLELHPEDAPQTVANFVNLSQDGFYNGVKFHRVMAGFMIQGGDPLSKDDSLQAQWGTGGPGYTFADEIHANNLNLTGTISMANAGPNTNGSQFFINVADNSFLDQKHTVFGRVVGGINVVMAISETEVDANDRPLEPVVINSVTIQ